MKITTSITLFWIWFTGSAALLEAIGVTKAMGITVSTGAAETLDKAVEGLTLIQGGGPTSESVMGLYILGTGAIETFLTGLTAGPRVLAGLGIPIEFVVFLHAPVGLLAGRMLIYAIAQRDL